MKGLRKRQWATYYENHKDELSDKSKERYYEDVEASRAKQRERTKTATGVYNCIKSRATKAGTTLCDKGTFLEWYDKQPKVCHYCGLPEEYAEVWSVGRQTQLAFDQKEAGVGYYPKNMVLACARCNTAKLNYWDHDTFLKLSETSFRPFVKQFLETVDSVQ